MTGDCVHPYQHRWPHQGLGNGLDWRAVRRGRQVYTEVFLPCHSLKYLYFRNFSYFMTPQEIKELAANYQTTNETPEEDGSYNERPCKPTDRLPKPYKNSAEARNVNKGALPPDLSNIVRMRHDGTNYVYALMTGYKEETPAGFLPLREGQYCNPYFPGGIIGMPAPLADDMVEYEDGVPATIPQMAKDVTQFLEFCHQPFHDTQEAMAMRGCFTLGVLSVLFAYYARRWGSAQLRGRIPFYRKLKW